MALFKKYTSAEILDKIQACCKRFPLTVFFCTSLALYLILLNHKGKDWNEQYIFFFTYYLSTSVILSLSLHLWSEEIKNNTWRIGGQTIIHFLWLASAVYLASQFPFDIIFMDACLAAIVLLCISIFLLSFFRQRNDIQIWNFTTNVLGSFVISVLISQILAGGIDLLLLSFDKLFGFEIKSQLYLDIFIICMTWLAPLLFLGLIPSGNKKHENTVVRLPRFGSGVIHFLFIPLLACYLLTLYIYALKIIYLWSLPTGWVSWLVTTLMISTLLIIALLYPTQFQENGKRFDRFILRYLPLIVLPLLLLMTIGIIRRFNDYGITISRLYLIIFNIWCYGVCIGLFFTRSRRIWWVPASFGIILFFISVGPQSIANITKRQLLNEISQMMNLSGIKHRPMNDQEYQSCLAKLDSTTARKLDDKLDYFLNSSYDKKSVSKLIDSTVTVGISQIKVETDTIAQKVCNEDNGKLFKESMPVPSGYSKVFYVYNEDNIIKNKKKECYTVTFVYQEKGKEKKLPIDFPLTKIKAMSQSKAAQSWIIKSNNYCLYISHFCFNKNTIAGKSSMENSNVRGILFLK